jgi:hypothetical protein
MKHHQDAALPSQDVAAVVAPQKEWMASDKDVEAIPENNMWLVIPSMMMCLFLAALDQTIGQSASDRHCLWLSDWFPSFPVDSYDIVADNRKCV